MAITRDLVWRLLPTLLLSPVLLVLLALGQATALHAQTVPGGQVSGTLVAWHRVTVEFTGSATSESAVPNPFLDRRLDVSFTHAASGQTCTVPGFFAADGQAAETSATAGTVWRAHFTPPLAGTWHYQASFRAGPDVAVADNALAGSPAQFDGQSGSIVVAPADPTAPGFLSEGRLLHDGGHYLRFAGSGRAFLKGGADSPENFLAYGDFDQTTATHVYAAHAGDWTAGDPTWKGGLGRHIVGAVNYLAGKGMNSVYFLTFNVGGDGDDVWMWNAKTERLRYDVSKLAQWEILFDHMDRLGLMLHVVTQETENDTGPKALDSGALGTQRKLYYRELVARFGHHLGVVWNLGEENTNSHAQREEFYDHIAALDAYDHPIVLHTYPAQQGLVYGAMLALGILEGASLQNSLAQDVHGSTLQWRAASALHGQPWVVTTDEIGPANVGVVPDEVDFWHELPRKHALWGNLMAGGAGAEWYFGYAYPDSDLTCENWRSREHMWDLTRIALDFFEQQLPFADMVPSDQLVSGNGAWCLAKPGDTYAVYLPTGGAVLLDLQADGNTYAVEWFDPRIGGGAQAGSVTTVSGPGWVSLGSPPYASTSDWALRVSVPEPADSPPQIVAAAALDLGPDIGVGALVLDPDGASDIASVVSWFFTPGGSFVVTAPMLDVGNDVWGLLLKGVPPVPSGDWPIAVVATDAAGQKDVFVTSYHQP
jgi:hypothetical protein